MDALEKIETFVKDHQNRPVLLAEAFAFAAYFANLGAAPKPNGADEVLVLLMDRRLDFTLAAGQQQ